MKKGFELEAEGGEIVIQNTNGDYAVIPKNKVEYVNKLLNDGCHGCIDEFVSTLPTMSSYAQDGTVVGDPLVTTTPPPQPYIQTAPIINPAQWASDFQRRQIEYMNNPQNKGIPTLGGNWRIPTTEERQGLINYYESLPQEELNDTQLEEYQSLKNNTYYVEGSPEESGTFRRYIFAPTDIRTTPRMVQQPIPTTNNAVPNSMLTPSPKFLTFDIAKGDNPYAKASIRIGYINPEDALRIKRDFASIKTDEDLRKSPYYSYVGDDYTKTPTTAIDLSKLGDGL